MRVYDGSVWQAAGSTVNGTAIRQTFTATAAQTTFTVTGGYDAGFADVYLNGVKLVNGVDVNVTSGTDVVLTTGAAAGDSVDVIAYGAFVIANTYTQAQVDAFAVKLTGDQTIAGVKTFSSPPVMGVSGLTGDIAAARITDALNASGSAPVYACRAWVNFNGTGTVAIRASGNVSSITDNGTGDYTVNFTTAMPDANYSVTGIVGDYGTINAIRGIMVSSATAPTTSALRIVTCLTSAEDQARVSIAIFR
jgi:hypothetical protein